MKRVSVLATGLAAAGALLLSGCGSSTTAADPTVPAVAAVPAVSAPAAPTPAASAPAAPAAPAAAESAAAQVVEASTCENDGTNAACACEGEAASCEETVLKARTDDGGLFGRKEGYVKWYDEGKGYGFISGDDGGADLFVHRSHVLGSTILKSGQRVSYELISDGLRGKPSLSNVQVL